MPEVTEQAQVLLCILLELRVLRLLGQLYFKERQIPIPPAVRRIIAEAEEGPDSLAVNLDGFHL
ncbi:MAG: hypothetical protein AB1700_05250 [Bacillota bacterium]